MNDDSGFVSDFESSMVVEEDSGYISVVMDNEYDIFNDECGLCLNVLFNE